MSTSTHHTEYDPALDVGKDQDLVALINESRDPQEIEQLAKTARTRQRARSKTVAALRRSSRGGHRLLLGRPVSFRH